MQQIYPFENQGSSGAKWRGAQIVEGAGGLCFGYSTIWCVKMQQYPDKPLLTKPDKFQAGLLQQRVEQMQGGWSNSVKKLVRLSGHGCGPRINVLWYWVPGRIVREGGHFVIDIGDHWMAAAAVNGKYSYFDSNTAGMQTTDSLDEFVDDFREYMKTKYKNDPDPDNNWEDKHNIYQIIL